MMPAQPARRLSGSSIPPRPLKMAMPPAAASMYWRIENTGPSLVTGADIQTSSDYDIVSKDLHICTITGDTLVTGAGRNVLNNFIPDVYAKQFDNLNFSLNQRITDGV